MGTKESVLSRLVYVGAYHMDEPDGHKPLTGKITALFDKHAKRGNRLFIEGLGGGGDTFDSAIRAARERGMEIVVPDAKFKGHPYRALRKLHSTIPRFNKDASSMDSEEKRLLNLEVRYLSGNVRERIFMAQLKKMAKPGDIVIMHPNHIRSILEQTGLSAHEGRNVHYLSPLKEFNEKTHSLSQQEINEMKNLKRKIHAGKAETKPENKRIKKRL